MLIFKGKDTVVLHMPKCAGSSVRWAIEKVYKDIRWTCGHAPIETLPERYKNFRRIGFCRNPLSWYLSKYYHDKKKFLQGDAKDTLVYVSLASDDFKKDFNQTLPILLDLNNFFDMNPNKLSLLKTRLKRLTMNQYLARIALTFEDISEIKPEFFQGTLYHYWYDLIGLDTAIIYKMDDDNFKFNVEKEFPGIKIGHRNKNSTKSLADEYSKNNEMLVSNADEYYFNKHNYKNSIIRRIHVRI